MDDPDKIVFHYTTLDGLLGITESASMWGTNILYLNDASEFSYAKELFSNELRGFRETNAGSMKGAESEKSWEYYFFEFLELNINKLLPSEHFSFFVCSFSEESDLLSQWRGYCKNGSGYSLGFALNSLQSRVTQAGFVIKPCVYDMERQTDAIGTLLRKASNRFFAEVGKTGEDWDDKAKYIAVDILLEFIQLAPFLKHQKFEEEHEWRIMAKLKTDYVKDLIKFRPGSTMIVPYIEIPLPIKGESLVIDELLIGPTSERELSMASVKLLLKSRNVICSSVKCSTIPYRAI